MANVSKYIKIQPKVLIQWTFDDTNFISENYKIITNINENKKKSFLSTTLLNRKSRNLFQIDPILRKYAVVDSSYNYLQEQDYSSSPVQYDKIKVFLPTTYNFTREGYIGFYIKVFSYGFENIKTYDLSNIFYDDTESGSGRTLLNLAIPFIYDETEWGKYFEFEIPSINYISNQRIRNGQENTTQPNTINYNLTTDGDGLSQTAPIFIDFRFLSSKELVLGTMYYYASDENRMSLPKAPEYQTLSVKVQESTEGDFFEIFGTYSESNENLNEFIEELETKGRRVKVEYDVYLYEENIQTSKQTFSVTNSSDFSEKIYYRPIMTFSNTTAAIKVTMKIIDLVDMSQIERYTTLGIRDNINKYGKKLISLDVSNITNLKIYNAKPELTQLSDNRASSQITTEIVKIPYPLLIDVGKIIVNSPKSSKFYKGMGLLNIIITPFDNIIQFRIAEIGSNNQLKPYNLSDISKGSLKLIFKSDTEMIEKNIFTNNSNNYTLGIINYRINENDINVLKKIYDKRYTNFYLALESNKMKTLLYSGTYSFYEDIRFIDETTDIADDGNLTKELSKHELPKHATTNEQIDWQPRAGKTVLIYTKSRASTTESVTQFTNVE